jgi:galactokinase
MKQPAVEHKYQEVLPLEPQRLALQFQQHFAAEQPRFFYAPGRVNLIGEHTDYNEGFVLPIAIGMGTMVVGVSRPDRHICVHSLNENETVAFSLDAQTARPPGHWLNYVEGVARSLEERGYHLRGANLLIESNIPVGSGLSSSAALENATAFALLSLSGESVEDRVRIALAGQQAEHHYVGTQCGVMDQLVTALAQKGEALLIDCRSLATQSIPMHLSDDLALVICDSRVKHTLASSAYNLRVEECKRGMLALQQGLPQIHSLRDVTETLLSQYSPLITDDIILKRVRHVVTENARTLEAAKALQAGDTALLGQLMSASHESLKNDYEVSCPELDTLVEIAQGMPGVIGARMTGGGFGGCTVNLVPQADLSAFIENISNRYQEAFGQQPHIYITQASEGMREIIPETDSIQAELNRELNARFDQAFVQKEIAPLIDFAHSQMPPLTTLLEEIDSIEAKLNHEQDDPLPTLAEIACGALRLTVSREFGIRIYDRGRQLTTDEENIPKDYPWFMHDPDDPEDIAGYATKHVARGSRGESPWPESQWPEIGAVRQGEQNWPHPNAAFGPYRLELVTEIKTKPAILLSVPTINGGSCINAYGVIPRGLFMMPSSSTILMALQHENHSSMSLSWSPWFVLGFAVPKAGTLTNPSTILAFPDVEAPDPIQDKITKVWNYVDIEGVKIALINPHAKTLNEPFKKLYKNVNWSIIAFKGSDSIILTRSILRHDEQFFPFLEHGRHFIEVEHTGPKVPPGQKSTVLVQHDLVPIRTLTQGKLFSFSCEKDQFEQEVRTILGVLVNKAKNGKL